MNIKIITPHGIKYEGECSRLQFPSFTGLMEILENHAPMIASVHEGEMTIDDDILDCGGGVLKVENNEIIIVCE